MGLMGGTGGREGGGGETRGWAWGPGWAGLREGWGRVLPSAQVGQRPHGVPSCREAIGFGK